MKSLLLLSLVALVAHCAADSHDKFKDMLHDVKDSDEFKHMSPDNKIILSELILAAEDGPAALDHYIHREGLSNILHFMEHLDQEDALLFESYLAHHFDQTHFDQTHVDQTHVDQTHVDQTHVDQTLLNNGHATHTGHGGSGHGGSGHVPTNRKRLFIDLSMFGELHTIREVLSHLPHEDRAQFQALMAAAKDNKLTQYIEKHGYGPVFSILSHVDEDNSRDFLKLLSSHLDKEAAMAAA